MTLPPSVERREGARRGRICQLATEVRLGKSPWKLVGWVRASLGGSRWLGETYHYRVDGAGFVWLNLDWLDTQVGAAP